MTNATCFTQHAPFQGPPLIQNGELTFQAHHVGWIIAGFFTIVATVASFWLIGKHLIWYTNKRQQRYIVRLLLMVPIYATVSLASFIFWNHAIPITLVRDCYEAFVLYSFFYLLLQYLSPTTEGQKEVFRHVVLDKWVFPLGFVKYRPKDGLYFLQLMKWGVLQYSVIRPATTLAAVILDFIGLYCEDSWSPGWGHVYITIIVSLSVTVAMYCLIQLYMPIATQLAPHKPLLKLVSVKAVVFLTFWQATGLSALSVFGVVKDTKYMTAEDINTGIAAILETFEMTCFAFLHIKAFSFHPYRDGHTPSERTKRFRSFMHALDLRDMWREIRDGSVYMGRTIRGVEAEEEIRRRIHFSKVMGRERELTNAKKWTKEGQAVEDDISEDDVLLKHGRRQDRSRREAWLSEPGDRFGGAFEEEVERELQRREIAKEYGVRLDLDQDLQGHTRGHSSWWRGIYDRLSQSEARDREERLSPALGRPSYNRRSRKARRQGSELPSLDSPPPPPSVMYDFSHPNNGRASVRLSHTIKPSGGVPGSYDTAQEPRIGHHYRHHKLNVSGQPHDHHEERPPTDGQFHTHTREMAAPQPVSASHNRHIELLVSGDHRSPPAEAPSPPNNHDSNLLAVPSSVVRSDSLLARVFPNSIDEHTSSDGRSNPASSQDTLSTSLMHPSIASVKMVPSTQAGRAGPPTAPMVSNLVVSDLRAQVHSSQSLPTSGNSKTGRAEPPTASMGSNLVSGSRTRVYFSRSPPTSGNSSSSATQLSPKRDHTCPNIVLPTPLSSARYPVESSRGNDLQYPGRPSVQIQQPPDQDVASSGSHGRPAQRMTLDIDTRATSDKRSSRRHSAQVDQPLARRPRASKRMSAPVEGLASSGHPASPSPRDQLPYNPTYDNQFAREGAMHSGWDMPFHYSRYPTSPTGSGTIPRTTSPSSPPRPLRRSRDDVGKIRRAWS